MRCCLQQRTGKEVQGIMRLRPGECVAGSSGGLAVATRKGASVTEAKRRVLIIDNNRCGAGRSVKDTLPSAGSCMLLDTPLRAGVIALLAAGAGLDARPSQASAPAYEIQIGAIESDNVERAASGGTSATIAFEELGFDWHDKRP